MQKNTYFSTNFLLFLSRVPSWEVQKLNDLIMLVLSEKHTQFGKIFLTVLTNQLIYFK